MEENGKLSDTELETLKAQFPNSFCASFEVDDEGNMAYIYVKKLDRTLYTAAEKFLRKDELTCGEYLIKNLWIAGYPKEKVIDSFEGLKNATATLVPLMYVKAGELKKN